MNFGTSEITELLVHSEAVHTADFARLRELPYYTSNVPNEYYAINNAISSIREYSDISKCHTDQTAPRPSLELLKSAYEDLFLNFEPNEHEPKENLWQFIGQHVLPLTGLPWTEPTGIEIQIPQWSGIVYHCHKASRIFTKA